MKGAFHVRGVVLKFTHVADNDTIVHGVHTHTDAFSPKSWSCVVSVLTRPLTHAPHELRHMKHSHIVSSR